MTDDGLEYNLKLVFLTVWQMKWDISITPPSSESIISTTSERYSAPLCLGLNTKVDERLWRTRNSKGFLIGKSQGNLSNDILHGHQSPPLIAFRALRVTAILRNLLSKDSKGSEIGQGLVK